MNRIRKFLKSFGPGLIIASVVLGPGSITVASRVGSQYGYVFLWVIVLAAVFMITYTSMAARFGVVSNDSFLQTVALRYGRWLAIAIGISAFLSSSKLVLRSSLHTPEKKSHDGQGQALYAEWHVSSAHRNTNRYQGRLPQWAAQ